MEQWEVQRQPGVEWRRPAPSPKMTSLFATPTPRRRRDTSPIDDAGARFRYLIRVEKERDVAHHHEIFIVLAAAEMDDCKAMNDVGHCCILRGRS